MFQRVGAKAFKKDLKNIKKLDQQLGHPHRSFKTIHIAGTNGKGSTSFYIAAALHQMGYKVGLYTSPHYKDYRERIKVDGTMITKRFVKHFINELIEKRTFEKAFKPSFFEISVAMAFSYFKTCQVDYAVIETGLGGRLDSTNIIDPQLSVITNIGLDHTQFLGDTIEQIAKEKAGIIKPKVPVVIGRKQKETTEVFASKAKKTNSELSYARKDKRLKAILATLRQDALFKIENQTTAYSSLKKLGLKFEAKGLVKAWTTGLKKWGYMGRLQELSRKPLVLVDSAHNRMGLIQLFDYLEKLKYQNLHVVLAMVGDKDLSLVLPLFPKAAHYYFSQAKIPRAKDKTDLRLLAEQEGLIGKEYGSIKRALASAKRRASSRDIILVAGSIFTVAEVV